MGLADEFNTDERGFTLGEEARQAKKDATRHGPGPVGGITGPDQFSGNSLQVLLSAREKRTGLFTSDIPPKTGISPDGK